MSTTARALIACAAWAVLAGAASGPAAAHESPSFDCASARHAAEQIVCRDAGLARVDRNLDVTYRRLMQEAGFFGRIKLRNEERAFLKDRDACESDYTCVRVTYRGQMQTFRDRSKQLGVVLDYE